MIDVNDNGVDVLIVTEKDSITISYDEVEKLRVLLLGLIQEYDERRIDIIGQNGNTGEHYPIT